MSAYILVSVLTGIAGGAYGMTAAGSGFWTMLGWYLIGGWMGLSLMVVTLLALSLMRGTSAQGARLT